MTLTAKDEIGVLDNLVPPQLSRDASKIFRMLDWSHLEALSCISQFGDLEVQKVLDSKVCGNEVRFEHAKLTNLEPPMKLRSAQTDRSAEEFDSTHLSTEELLSFCNASFGSQLSGGNQSRRPYASAGALFPVSVFAVPLTSSGHAAGSPLYYLPESKQFQEFGTTTRNHESLSEDLLKRATADRRVREKGTQGRPTDEKFGGFRIGSKSSKLCFGDLPPGRCTSIVYVINIQRAIAKYRLRGIKHAFIEVGEMIQLSAINARKARLGQRCWSAHNEAAIKTFLGLHPNLYEIGMVQLLGKKPSR